MGEMKDQLLTALRFAEQGDLTVLTEMAGQIKRLPRTPEGLFDTTSVDEDCFEAAKYVYPVYAAFETACNRQEGYPDLLAQIRVLDERQKKAAALETTAVFLRMLCSVIGHVTPQLYEYYRELVDMFRADVKEMIASYYKDGSFGGEEGRISGLDGRIRVMISRAGDAQLLLAEKYRSYGCCSDLRTEKS